jgi:hypothetical protein
MTLNARSLHDPARPFFRRVIVEGADWAMA